MNVQFSGVEKYLCGYRAGVKKFLNPEAKQVDILTDSTTDTNTPNELIFGISGTTPVIMAINENGHGVFLDGQDVVSFLSQEGVPGATNLSGKTAQEVEADMLQKGTPLSPLFDFLFRLKQDPTELVNKVFAYARQALDAKRDAEGKPVKDYLIDGGKLVDYTQQ